MSLRPALVLLAAACLVLPGCLAVAAGAAAGYGTHQYVTNEGAREFQAPLESAWGASIAALDEVGAPVASPPSLGATEGRLAARDYQVRVEKLSETSSRVRVRVGTFSTEDHRRRAGLFLDAVARRLGA
jgi:hypothetical protein